MTLREAAERTSRSITTLRRYIRSGRLHAEKHYGRFGPEYFVSEQDLADAGLDADAGEAPTSLARVAPAAKPIPRPDEPAYDRLLLREIVPLPLYQDLQMKHEQLLVQYGMVRAGGLRAIELREDLEERERRIEEVEDELSRVERRHADELSTVRRQLREASLELEGRRLEIEALQEKVRALEMLARNSITSETIDLQLRRFHEQAGLVDSLAARSDQARATTPTPASPPRSEPEPRDH